jgi:triosephosphate isomerase
MREKVVVGNWKMFTTAASAADLARAIVAGVAQEHAAAVAICPPFPYLQLVAGVVSGTSVGLGAQNLYPQAEGAFTGEVSPTMLRDVGCRYVIVGHSERRHKLGESNAFIQQKVLAGIEAGLRVILCLGETLAERENDQTEGVLRTQLRDGMGGLARERSAQLIIAYEPVWAIGTGRNATPDQAQEAHAFIRQQIADLWGEETAQAVPIQYGGSVKPDNAASLLSQPDVDGALVGGASLDAAQFLAIVRSAR